MFSILWTRFFSSTTFRCLPGSLLVFSEMEKVGRSDRWTSGWKNERMDGWVVGWGDEWVSDWVDRWKGEREGRWLDRWLVWGRTWSVIGGFKFHSLHSVISCGFRSWKIIPESQITQKFRRENILEIFPIYVDCRWWCLITWIQNKDTNKQTWIQINSATTKQNKQTNKQTQREWNDYENIAIRSCDVFWSSRVCIMLCWFMLPCSICFINSLPTHDRCRQEPSSKHQMLAEIFPRDRWGSLSAS